MPVLAPEVQPVPAPIHRLRWRFDFAGRPSRCGIWNGAGRPEDGAWAVDKAGLVRAAIEMESVVTQETTVALELDGADYASAQWEAYARVSNVLAPGRVAPPSQIAGLSFLTRTEKITVFVDGRLTRRDLTAEEKKLSTFTEHTAGT